MLAPGVLARLGGLNDEIGIMLGVCGGAEIGEATDTTRKLRGRHTERPSRSALARIWQGVMPAVITQVAADFSIDGAGRRGTSKRGLMRASTASCCADRAERRRAGAFPALLNSTLDGYRQLKPPRRSALLAN